MKNLSAETLLESRACPDCGAVDEARSMFNVLPVPCPRCRLKRGLVEAFARQGTHERYCPICEYTLTAGGWLQHVASKGHKLNVRLVLGALAAPPLTLEELRKAVSA